MVSYKIVLSEKNPKVWMDIEDQYGKLIVDGKDICEIDAHTQDHITRQLLESCYCINLDEEKNKKLKELLNNNQIDPYYGHDETDIKSLKDMFLEGN